MRHTFGHKSGEFFVLYVHTRVYIHTYNLKCLFATLNDLELVMILIIKTT